MTEKSARYAWIINNFLSILSFNGYSNSNMLSENRFRPPLLQEEFPYFNRYQIPPDFDIVELHQQAALVYDQRSPYGEACPCCFRKLGSKKVPICTGTANFLRISPQIPLYFSYLKAMTIVLLIFAAACGTQRMFSPSLQIVSFRFMRPDNNEVYTIQIGFIQTDRVFRFLLFLLFTILILFVRAFLKKSKYQVTNMSKKLSDRSVMLTNVPRNATEAQIRKKFDKFQIQNVELTYRVKRYIESLQGVYRLKKTCMMAKKRKKSSKYITNITQDIILKNQEIKMIKNRIKSAQNRLDFVFITFKDKESCDIFLKKHEKGILGRLFYKFCTCCSSTAIHGQHINVFPGPDAQDIDWLNLESSYWVKKIHRFACYYMSFAILIFGVLIQYQISTFPAESLYISIIKNLVVLVGNFLVVNLLEFTTYEVEKHETNTRKVLSLIRKLTFFVFLNLSMSPFSIYLYYEFSSNDAVNPNDTPFDELCLSILIISIGNITKPLMEYLNVGRILKRLNFWYQRFLQQDCQMTQEEANLQFEPIPFPLASFYSLFLSALYLTAFFLSSFQSIVAVEVLSCFILYVLSKYMLLRVCRQPIGLDHAISVLCQRMLIFCIPLYFLGEKIMYFICVQQQKNFGQYLEQLLQLFTLIEAGVIVFVMFFSSTLLANISKRVIADNQISDSMIQRANKNNNTMTYAELNSIKQLEEELKKYIDSVQ